MIWQQQYYQACILTRCESSKILVLTLNLTCLWDSCSSTATDFSNASLQAQLKLDTSASLDSKHARMVISLCWPDLAHCRHLSGVYSVGCLWLLQVCSLFYGAWDFVSAFHTSFCPHTGFWSRSSLLDISWFTFFIHMNILFLFLSPVLVIPIGEANWKSCSLLLLYVYKSKFLASEGSTGKYSVCRWKYYNKNKIIK